MFRKLIPSAEVVSIYLGKIFLVSGPAPTESCRAITGKADETTEARNNGSWLGGRNLLNSLSVFGASARSRSEEHTSELQSRFDLVCRLLLEKKNKYTH